MSDSEYSLTAEEYDQIYLVFSQYKKTSWPVKTNKWQTKEKTVVMKMTGMKMI